MNSPRILVVDDELFIRELLCEFLGKSNYEVVSANGAAEALQLIQSYRFELAIVDLKMPDMSGAELLRLIKRMTDEIRIILMSGYASVPAVVEAYREGADDFLTKPFRLNELLSVVARVREKHQYYLKQKSLGERLQEIEIAARLSENGVAAGTDNRIGNILPSLPQGDQIRNPNGGKVTVRRSSPQRRAEGAAAEFLSGHPMPSVDQIIGQSSELSSKP